MQRSLLSSVNTVFELIREFLVSHPETRLFAAFAVWASLGLWVWVHGWKVVRHYLVRAELTPIGRGGIWWTTVLVGATFVIAAEQRPASAAVVGVAMMGTLSTYVDWKTHKLPNSFTTIMVICVAIGVVMAALMDPYPHIVFFKAAGGALLWFLPLWLLSYLPQGLGFGDVKLSPVLGAMLGVLGVDAALMGLLASFLAAGLYALWKVAAAQVGTDSRMPMGPWLIFGAVFSHLVWGVFPDWLSPVDLQMKAMEVTRIFMSELPLALG